MPLSTYARNKLMDYLASHDTHLSLHSKDPGLDGQHEISKTRVKVSFSAFAAVDGEVKSSSAALFEEMPASTVTHIGVWDSMIGGNFLFAAELLAKKTVDEGDAIKLSAGHVILGLT